LTHIPNIVPSGTAAHPANIIMLTCDAYGVLPPIAHLSKEQAMFHFLSGYTARVAGTEAGVKEPSATFSTCFGGPFMALNPTVYGELLREKISHHNVSCWLVNTGWNGGPYGIGERIKICYSRALVNAALDGTLLAGNFEQDAFFGLAIPTSCPGVPSEILNPRNTWADAAMYDDAARKLVAMFKNNFTNYHGHIAPEVAGVL